MPTTIINAHAVKSAGNVDLAFEFDDRNYAVSLAVDEINTPEKLARWLLAQQFPTASDGSEYRRRLTVTWHYEAIEGGGQTKVLDSVVSDVAEEETAWTALLASPLATVTIAQADAAVDAIANLADAKTYLKKVNALVIAQRDVLKRILALLKAQRLR